MESYHTQTFFLGMFLQIAIGEEHYLRCTLSNMPMITNPQKGALSAIWKWSGSQAEYWSVAVDLKIGPSFYVPPPANLLHIIYIYWNFLTF